ncbi:MAG: AAA family ATPase [Armatimonadetes bacterium]|nr:AAA family ATPase [Armatimonadota bacterium]
MVIGLTGRYAAGKGEVAQQLKAKGFIYHSLSDALREELTRRGEEITRERLTQVGNELRQNEGSGVLARLIMSRLDPAHNAIVDSIRNPMEVEALRSLDEFFLLFVDAPAEVRFERLKARARERDPVTWEEFQRMEGAEVSGASHQQQLAKVEELADFHVTNGTTLEDLHQQVDDVVCEMQARASTQRPSWDAYFMDIATVVSRRSNCMKRKVAAVIVKDKRIISTGYNGTPRGVRNCNEGGCPRCNSFTQSGSGLTECLCSHGEENAIVQAAYHGIAVKDSTLYSTFSPCLLCTKMIINSGIKRVVYKAEYPLNEVAFDLFRQAGVQCEKL